MGTNSKDESGSRGAEADALEPSGLSATASASSPRSAPRALQAPGHQQAVELVSIARRHLREGTPDEAKQLFRQAAELERQVLRQVDAQPERSLIAEYGARAALQGGRFSLAKELVRKGSVPQPSEPMQWSLLRVRLEADLLEFLDGYERGWEIPWDRADENEYRIVVTSRSGRRFGFYVEPEAESMSEKKATPDEVAAFAIPTSYLSTAALEGTVARWLQPRRRMQPVLEQRGLTHHYLLDLALP